MIFTTGDILSRAGSPSEVSLRIYTKRLSLSTRNRVSYDFTRFMAAPPPRYSAQFLLSIERTVTRARLSRYLTASSQNITQAVQLYEYNIQLSEALYGVLHGLEVMVRNAAHHALSAGYGLPGWYDRVSFNPYWDWAGVLKDAKNKAGGSKAAPGKVVAELTFGFWVDLCSKRNNNNLWVHRKLAAAFPNAGISRDRIHQRLKIV